MRDALTRAIHGMPDLARRIVVDVDPLNVL
jgi:hypothetical protein